MSRGVAMAVVADRPGALPGRQLPGLTQPPRTGSCVNKPSSTSAESLVAVRGHHQRGRDPRVQGVLHQPASSRQRPRSAVHTRPVSSSRSAYNSSPHSGAGPAAAGGGTAAVRALSADNLRLLKEQCFEIKTTSNTISEDTMKIKTRLMGLEREIVKRDRILKSLEHVNQYGPGITMDILEKLREERGLASLYKKKAQDLIVQIEDKDKDVRQLKQDRHFTDIVERQVELASWQHEAQRLASLLQESSPELNDVAKQEIDVMTQYVEDLKGQLSNAEEKRDLVETELAEFKSEHATAEGEHQERQTDLTKEQDITRTVATSFKEVLQKRKAMEQMEDEIESMQLEMQKMGEEIRIFKQLAEDGESERLPRVTVSQAALEGKPLWNLPDAVVSRLRSLRCLEGELWGQDCLLACMLKQDQDSDGLLDEFQLAEALKDTPCKMSAEEARKLMEGLPKSVAPSFSGVRSLRWMDLLLLLDRLPSKSAGSAQPAPALPPMPALRPLRAACLRSETSQEDLASQLMHITAFKAEAEACFLQFGLDAPAAKAWATFWQAHGRSGSLLQLPLGEVARSRASRASWMLRCQDAIHSHRQELEQAFGDTELWKDYSLNEEQFRMVCHDIMGMQLLSTDILDLFLLLCNSHSGTEGQSTIDCRLVLQLATESG